MLEVHGNGFQLMQHDQTNRLRRFCLMTVLIDAITSTYLVTACDNLSEAASELSPSFFSFEVHQCVSSIKLLITGLFFTVS